MNDIIFRSLSSDGSVHDMTYNVFGGTDVKPCSTSLAGIPASKEPTGLTKLDGKRPDVLTLVPWQRDKPVTWDVTVVSTLA